MLVVRESSLRISRLPFCNRPIFVFVAPDLGEAGAGPHRQAVGKVDQRLAARQAGQEPTAAPSALMVPSTRSRRSSLKATISRAWVRAAIWAISLPEISVCARLCAARAATSSSEGSACS